MNPTTHLEYTVLHIFPAMQCDRCPRWTNLAIIDTTVIDSFCPRCALHGYAYSSPDPRIEPTIEQIEREHDSIRRFVVWAKGDQGRVTVVSLVHDLATIAGYERDPEADFDDDGWYALYIAPDGTRKDCHAIWSPEYLQFFLIEDGQLIDFD